MAGIGLFMGLVKSRIMKGLTPETRSEVVKRLVPVMLFLMPALAGVAITLEASTSLGGRAYSTLTRH